MKYKRFEIWLADLNPRFGTEAGKARPVLIIQSDLLNKVHPSTVVCPITTNVIPGVNILRINIDEGEGGMSKTSSIMIDQIRAIDNRRFVKKIGMLPIPLQKRVIENIKIVLDLEQGSE
jgi:mRNA interferase MazF